MNESILNELRPALVTLMQGWITSDGRLFASAFAEDGDHINIYGAHATGRSEVASWHDKIFSTIFAGSVVEMKIIRARMLASDVSQAIVVSNLTVPNGPRLGKSKSIATVTFVRKEEVWQIASFHNTRLGA